MILFVTYELETYKLSEVNTRFVPSTFEEELSERGICHSPGGFYIDIDTITNFERGRCDEWIDKFLDSKAGKRIVRSKKVKKLF